MAQLISAATPQEIPVLVTAAGEGVGYFDVLGNYRLDAGEGTYIVSQARGIELHTKDDIQLTTAKELQGAMQRFRAAHKSDTKLRDDEYDKLSKL